jgi:hypothetical protein
MLIQSHTPNTRAGMKLENRNHAGSHLQEGHLIMRHNIQIRSEREVSGGSSCLLKGEY